jgi:DNA-directed RNA polymerase subunit RPC12/RpoP
MREHEICSSCGADLTGTDASAHVYQHMINGDDKGGWHSEWREEVTGYQTVHHDAVTHTETVITGYRCSTCGATK